MWGAGGDAEDCLGGVGEGVPQQRLDIRTKYLFVDVFLLNFLIVLFRFFFPCSAEFQTTHTHRFTRGGALVNCFF